MNRLYLTEVCKDSRVTRRDGEALRDVLEAHWSDVEPLILDFEGAAIASASFFDESFGALALRYPLAEVTRRIKVENIAPEDRRLLNTLVRARQRERDSSAKVLQGAPHGQPEQDPESGR
ncbi:MAG TPA: STAS-like domain-containing protein [Polyangiaceae bacterium]|jgi:hypothetical protein